jgi:hypothetical protein
MLSIREIELALFEIRYADAYAGHLIDIASEVPQDTVREIITDRVLFIGSVGNVIYLGVVPDTEEVERVVTSPAWQLPEIFKARGSGGVRGRGRRRKR